MGARWEDWEWMAFAKEFHRLQQLPENKERKYLGPVFMKAQRVLPELSQRDKSYFAARGVWVKERIKPLLDALNSAPEGSDITYQDAVKVDPKEAQQESIDYEKLANMVCEKLRKEIIEHAETFLKVELDEFLARMPKPTSGLPAHMLDTTKKSHPHSKLNGKVRVTLFGIEEKNKNTNRFNYLNHVLDIRIWHGNEPHAAKMAADGSELSLIAINSMELTHDIIKEIKKSPTKTVFTTGGLSAVDSALQTFCTLKGLRFTTPEHPSHQH